MRFHRLLVPLMVVILANGAADALAQGAFPDAMGAPAQGFSEQCTKEFAPLRQDAEKRGKLIRAASDRHAGPDEACTLIENFSQAETKMIDFVEAHLATCGIPAQVANQLKAGHKNTESLQKRVCTVAQQILQRGPAGPSGDFDPPSTYQ